MFKKIAVTNRHLCDNEFLAQIEKVAESGVDAIILREKDLTEEEYESLAQQVIKICAKYQTDCILHSYIAVANKLDHPYLHVPLWKIREETSMCQEFMKLGVSVHSVEEAIEAEKLGASYVIAGHIFETTCKPGLPPRGIDFLERVVKAVAIPVYAIGGITSENLWEIEQTGAEGACIMSKYMRL